MRSLACSIFSSQHWPRRDRYSRSVEWDKCEFETCAWWRYIASEPHDDWAAISSTKFLKAQNARSQDFHFGGFYTKCWVHNLQKVSWDILNRSIVYSSEVLVPKKYVSWWILQTKKLPVEGCSRRMLPWSSHQAVAISLNLWTMMAHGRSVQNRTFWRE